jgi:sugar/nucleoside kinase (ribokinase family)
MTDHRFFVSWAFRTIFNCRERQLKSSESKKDCGIMRSSFELIVVGHQTIDEIVLPGQPVRRSPGGPATFASLASTRMGRSSAIISRVGRDFPDEYVQWLVHRGVNLDWVIRDQLSETTRFEIRYQEGMEERHLRLVKRCSEILPKDIPSDIRARAVHLGPVAGEISLETARQARKISELLSIDLQGCVRDFGPKGEVTLTGSLDQRLIDLVDIIKVSEDELTLALSCDNVSRAKEKLHLGRDKVFIVTRGKAGSKILRGDEVVEMLAYPVRRVRNPTGAGDAFMGVFVTELAHGSSLDESAAMGSASASFLVEGFGLGSFGSREEVSERASALLKH